MNKEELYQQINEFNNTLTDKDNLNSDSYQKARLYVGDEEAIDKAQFINYLIKEKYLSQSYSNILDMTFGSGNLTSHIIFDNEIIYKSITLNDINSENTNKNIKNYIDNCSITEYDILEKTIMSTFAVDLVILNPQIGGTSYPKGNIQKQTKERETKKQLIERLFKNIEIYLQSGATIIFYGKEKDFKDIFEDKQYIRYINSTQQLYIIKNSFTKTHCFEKGNGTYNKIDCNKESLEHDEKIRDFDNLDDELVEFKSNNQTSQNIDNKEDNLLEFTNKEDGNIEFPHKNILLKGVPGTGKSKTIDNIIFNVDKLNMKNLSDNVLRINIHSASSNSDLMQGVSISTTENNENVLYKEKQGAILNHIFKAICKPKQPFVLVLEEIQENSLNELIGDLIYLIEDKKRTIVSLDIDNDTKIAYNDLFEKVDEKAKEEDKDLHYVELPSLVENSQKNTKMIVPNNLFIFCTSNYRDDKKVIEDNLLRRFDVVEIYPTYNETIYTSKDIPKFLKKLNDDILKQFKDETHPDRYMIGHANWLEVGEEDKIGFYKALLKVIVEFKEIREIDFDSDVKPILEKLFKKDNDNSERIKEYLNIFHNGDSLELKSYKSIVDSLQQEVYKSFL